MKEKVSILLLILVMLASFRFIFDYMLASSMPDGGKYFMSSEGDQLFYRKIFKHPAEAPTILIIPGMGAHAFSSKKLIDNIARKANIYVVERHSYGFSRSSSKNPDLNRYSRSLEDFLKSEAVTKKINLIGLSLGSAYAIHFYRKHPDRIRSLAFVDCALPEHVSASDVYLNRVLYDWLRILKRQRIKSYLSIPQLRATALYTANRLTRQDLIELQSKHLGTTIMEGDMFWEILEQVDFYSDYEDLDFLVVSTSNNEEIDWELSDVTLKEHAKLAEASKKGLHKIFTSTSHHEILNDKDQKLSKLYLDFITKN